MAYASSDAVAEIDSAIRAWGDRASEIGRQATNAAKALLSAVEADVQERSRRVRALEDALASSRGEARARLARELQASTAALEAGRRNLRQAKDLQERAQSLQRRLSEATNSRVPQASAALKRKLAALEEYHSTSVMQNVMLGAGALASFLPGSNSGPAAHDANLQQASDTVISRQTTPDVSHSEASTLYKIVEQQDDPKHQIGHAYTDQEMKDAEQRTKQPGRDNRS